MEVSKGGEIMEVDEARDRCSEAVDKLAEAMAQTGTALREMLLCMNEMVSAICKQWLEDVDFSSLTELAERWKLEEQRQKEDRQKASELKLVSKRIVKLSKSKQPKIQKKNMARIRKELRLYEKRR